MGRLLRKLTLLIAPYLLALAAILVTIESNGSLRKGVFNPELAGKIIGLYTPDTEIIIAGDSRAERQVIPAVIREQTGKKAISIATAACDLITLANAAERYHLFEGNKTLIVSASVFQLNDGAVETGYLSPACLYNMTLWEKFRVHRHVTDRLLRDLTRTALKRGKEGKPDQLTEDRLKSLGFNGIIGTLVLPVTMNMHKHPWYRAPEMSGARRRIFAEALGRLSAGFGRVILYAPPVSPAWQELTAGTFVDRIERDYLEIMRQEASRHPNVIFVDFYSAPDPQLGNAQYYDVQHLNIEGAARFSVMLGNLIVSRSK